MSLRLFVKRHMRPMSAEKAGSIRTKLSMVYAFLAWNTTIVVAYLCFKDYFPRTSNSEQYAKLLGVENVRVIKFSGLSKTEDYIANNTREDIERYRTNINRKNKTEEA